MLKNKQPVWDVPVRLLHWSLVAAVVAAWLTGEQTGPVHEYLGYAAGAIVLARLAWGFAGNRYARFSHFVRPPAATVAYARSVVDGTAPRHLGHNPLGGWMVLALLACLGLLCLSGWALGTDLLWGYAWPVLVHTAIAWTLVALVALHLGGVAFTSWKHHENLAAAMLTGSKRPPQERDID